MTDRVYLDTSALAKWYLNEVNSEEFTEFLRSIPSAIISPLTITEMRSLLSRRRRMFEISESLEMEIFATFQMDMDKGYLHVVPFETRHFEDATHIIGSLNNIALRTLDALHLTIIQYYQIDTLATADQVMITAAKALNIQVKAF
ncbi:MAG: type II toxin-antitoxin system VapC family toxin [Legionellales bacterium]|nr:type II toxin-antitoxin system VapC family toxin [Legionellales bacterium]